MGLSERETTLTNAIHSKSSKMPSLEATIGLYAWGNTASEAGQMSAGKGTRSQVLSLFQRYTRLPGMSARDPKSHTSSGPVPPIEAK